MFGNDTSNDTRTLTQGENEPEDSNEQQIFHSLATVSTLLLRLGEAGKKINQQKEIKTQDIDIDWSITYKQFLASFLTESVLAKYFDKKIDITKAIKKYRNRRLLLKQNSESFS